jgi:hypothetical protein
MGLKDPNRYPVKTKTSQTIRESSHSLRPAFRREIVCFFNKVLSLVVYETAFSRIAFVKNYFRNLSQVQTT